MLVKRHGSRLALKAIRRYDEMMLPPTDSCMVVGETGGRRCERCGKQPDILHVP
jgi:hypothetical protein